MMKLICEAFSLNPCRLGRAEYLQTIFFLTVFPVSLLASEIQMMALPHAQYVLADPATPVTAAANSSQVKTVRPFTQPSVGLSVFLLMHIFVLGKLKAISNQSLMV